MTESQIYPSGGLLIFAPSEMKGANLEILHGRLFTSATAPIGGITLVAVYSAWAAGMEDILEIFHCYPFG